MEARKHPLTRYRETKKISLQALGEALGGINKSTVLRWEQGAIDIPPEFLEKIERATGVPRHELRPDIFKGYARSREAAA
jgi:DNA-binding transcriptional regulator YdaS (Cro superfamily)